MTFLLTAKQTSHIIQFLRVLAIMSSYVTLKIDGGAMSFLSADHDNVTMLSMSIDIGSDVQGERFIKNTCAIKSFTTVCGIPCTLSLPQWTLSTQKSTSILNEVDGIQKPYFHTISSGYLSITIQSDKLLGILGDICICQAPVLVRVDGDVLIFSTVCEYASIVRHVPITSRDNETLHTYQCIISAKFMRLILSGSCSSTVLKMKIGAGGCSIQSMGSFQTTVVFTPIPTMLVESPPRFWLPTCILPEYWRRHKLSPDDVRLILTHIPTNVVWILAIMLGFTCPMHVLKISMSSMFDIVVTGKSPIVEDIIRLHVDFQNVINRIPRHRGDTHVPPLPEYIIDQQMFADMLRHITNHLLPEKLVPSGDTIGHISKYFNINDIQYVPIAIEGDVICCQSMIPYDTYTNPIISSHASSPVIGRYNNQKYVLVDEFIIVRI